MLSQKRQEAYDKIKSLKLEEAVKNKYGVNYTQVKTDFLEDLIATESQVNAQKPLERLVKILKEKYVLCKEEIAFIFGK